LFSTWLVLLFYVISGLDPMGASINMAGVRRGIPSPVITRLDLIRAGVAT
jgi:hypothetical protein